MLQGFVISSYVLGLKTILTVIYNQMITRNRYIRDTYKELDISELPPGEVLQTSWNGDSIFVRRLTMSEVQQTNALPAVTELDKVSKCTISDAGNSKLLCCSAICTHLGCSPTAKFESGPQPSLPNTWPGGFLCPCHGSTFDMAGRVYKNKPAPDNLEVPPHMYLSDTKILIGEDKKA